MKTILLFLSTLAYSQTLTPTLSQPFSYPGSSLILTIGFLNNTPTPITSLQWTVSLPTGVSLGSPALGAASIAAGATVTCTPTSVCTTTVSATAFPNIGTVVTFPVVLSSTAALGAQQIALTAVGANMGAVIVTSPTPAPLQINVNSGTSTWFQATVGQGTCRASKVPQTPIRISWVCFNSYGANSGSYTADANNGGNGGNFFYIGINSMGVPSSILANENLSCQIQINATMISLTMLSGAVLPAGSAAYSCTGYSMSGSGVLTWS